MNKKYKPTKNLLFLTLLSLLCATLNVIASIAAGETHFPLYMDSFATIAIAALGGLAPSIVVAILTNGSLFLLGRLKLIFMLCQLMTAVGSWAVFKLARKRDEEKLSLDFFMLAGILSACTNGIFGSLFAAYYHYNLTAIEQGIFFVTKNVIAANLTGGFLLNLVDKAIASFIAYGMYLFARTSDRRLPAETPRLQIKPEYIYLMISFFVLCVSFAFRKNADDKFSRLYETAVMDERHEEIQEIHAQERFINKGFDSVLYASFLLAAISGFIMHVKLSRQKSQIQIIKARDETQKEFSRDLHDGIIQSLSVLKICLSQNESGRALLIADEAVKEARELLGLSRLDLSFDFKTIVRQCAKVFEETYKIKPNVYEASEFADGFSYAAKYEMLKILQEALRNAAKHSGATEIEIRMIDTTDNFIFSVTDNGCGFADKTADEKMAGEESQNSATHAGLKIMEERAAALGGKLNVKSDQNGASVRLIIPIKK